jgi:Tetratricopeptide repeat
MTLLIILISLYVAIFITSPFITIFHELGHAVAYLILTKPNKVDIYIGSYGDSKETMNFKIGKLNFYVKHSFPFIKSGGLCKSDKIETSYLKYIIILLAGPVFTLLMACAIGLIIFNVEVHGSIKLFCFALIICSIISLFVNLRPRTILRSGVNLDNDGKQILFAINHRKVFSNYIAACQYFEKGEFASASLQLKHALEKIPGDRGVFRLLINSLLQAKNFDDAGPYLSEFEKKFELLPLDRLNKGCLESFTEKHEEAILSYRVVLEDDKNNVLALNNLGYELNEKCEWQEAEQLLEKGIKLSPEFDHLYANLGYTKVLQGDLEAGKILIEKCIELNPKNAYAYKNLGIYYIKIKNLNLAKTNFDKAIEFDDTFDLSIYINEIKVLAKEQDISSGG